jgi:hypothetical protein
LTAEDDIARTFRPRLRLAGADLKRVLFWTGIRRGGIEDYVALPEFPDDAQRLSRHIRKYGVKLVIIDPIFAFLSAKMDAHKDQHIRRVLSALARIAEEHQVAMVAIRHLNKTVGGPGIYRGSGSIGVIGQARVGLLLGPDENEPSQRILAQTKNNLARIQQSRVLRITSDGGHNRIEWVGESDYSANEVLSQAGKGKKVQQAIMQWLMTELAGGPRRSADLFTLGNRVGGWSVDQLKRTKAVLGLKTTKEGQQWLWSLPYNPKALDPTTGVEVEDGEQKQTKG